MTGAFDLSGTDHAFGVCQQNDFEQDLGVDGSRASLVIFVALVEDQQVDVLVHQPVDGVLQCSRNKLILERDGEHDHLIFIAWFVFCHRVLCHIKPRRMNLVINFPLFRQFQRFVLLTLGRAAGRCPMWTMKRRRRLLGISPEPPAPSTRFVRRRFLFNQSNPY